MRMIYVAVAVLAITTVTTGCTQEQQEASGVSGADLYAVGCPLLDGALGGTEVARKGAAWSLDQLANQTTDENQQTWLANARDALQSTSVNDVPANVQESLMTPCSQAGHPLTNLA